MNIRIENQPKCLLCGKEGQLLYSNMSDRLFSVEGSWNLLQCKSCGLIWLHPRPIKDDIGKLYVKYHTHEAAKSTRHSSSLRDGIRQAILKAVFGYPIQDKRFYWLGSLLSRISVIRDTVGAQIMMLDHEKRGGLLDVGAGNGIFLKTMQDLGWEVTGIEPDPDAAQIARDTYGLSVFTQTLDDTDIPHENFDIITMDHVIEHFSDPLAALSKIYQLLKPGGRVVIMTPNTKSLGHSIFKSSWLHLDPPRHFYLFDHNSLETMVKSVGFTIENSRTVASSAWWVWISSSIIKYHGQIKNGQLAAADLRFSMKLRGIFFELAEELRRLKLLPGASDSGEELYLMARK